MLESKYFVSNIQNLTIKQDEQRIHADFEFSQLTRITSIHISLNSS